LRLLVVGAGSTGGYFGGRVAQAAATDIPGAPGGASNDFAPTACSSSARMATSRWHRGRSPPATSRRPTTPCCWRWKRQGCHHCRRPRPHHAAQ